MRFAFARLTSPVALETILSLMFTRDCTEGSLSGGTLGRNFPPQIAPGISFAFALSIFSRLAGCDRGVTLLVFLPSRFLPEQLYVLASTIAGAVPDMRCRWRTTARSSLEPRKLFIPGRRLSGARAACACPTFDLLSAWQPSHSVPVGASAGYSNRFIHASSISGAEAMRKVRVDRHSQPPFRFQEQTIFLLRQRSSSIVALGSVPVGCCRDCTSFMSRGRPLLH